jgi:hypothetical protein
VNRNSHDMFAVAEYNKEEHQSGQVTSVLVAAWSPKHNSYFQASTTMLMRSALCRNITHHCVVIAY